MNVEEQVASLKARHAELEEALTQENARPLPDAATISPISRNANSGSRTNSPS